MTFCNGEIQFYGDGTWFCLECDYRCNEPGDVDFLHMRRFTPEQRALNCVRGAFDFLLRDDWNPGVAITQLHQFVDDLIGD